MQSNDHSTQDLDGTPNVATPRSGQAIRDRGKTHVCAKRISIASGAAVIFLWWVKSRAADPTILDLLQAVCLALLAFCLIKFGRRTILLLKGPLFALAIFTYLLLTDQGLEALRAIFEAPLLTKTALVLVWSALLFCLALSLISASVDAAANSRSARQSKTDFKLSLAIGLSGAFLVAAGACFSAALSLFDYVLALLFAGLGSICIYQASWIDNSQDEIFEKHAKTEDGQRFIELNEEHKFFSLVLSNVIVAIWVVAVILPYALFLVLPSFNVDSILFLTVWISGVVGVSVLIARLSRKFRFPVFFSLVSLVMLWSVFDLNDHHELAYARSGAPPLAASDAFRDWSNSREPTRNGVLAFIVAAEGGGARAAYMTAAVLEELRARCKQFRRLHFATLGVSGGALGAALSAASVTHPDAKEECTRALNVPIGKAVSVAGTDVLSPLLRGFLTLDLPIGVLPTSLWQTRGAGQKSGLYNRNVAFDRAQYVETRLNHAWETPGDVITGRGFAQAWPGPTADVPALVLLATDVASGRRVAISHLRFGSPSSASETDCLSPTAIASEGSVDDRARLLTMADIAPGRDPTLLGAALTSARFPLVTPAATLPCPRPGWRLVDGGYFENSGLTTALELLEQMARGYRAELPPRPQGADKPPTRWVVLLRIENGGATTNRKTVEGAEPPGPENWLSELMSPVRAFMATREARADQARRSVDLADGQALSGTCADADPVCIRLRVARLQLRPCQVPIPLGWRLSERAQREIRAQLGLTNAESGECVQAAAKSNSAVVENIFRYASGEKLPN